MNTPLFFFLHSDIVGFTAICSLLSPMDVVKILNLLYTKFDDFCGIFEVYKIGRNQLLRLA